MAENQDIQDQNTELEAQAPEGDVAENVEIAAPIAANGKAKRPFNVGDRVVVNYKIVEGTKSRIQPYEGIVIGIKGSGVSRTFTVRRMAAGNIGVERIFPMKSPNIDSISVKSRGRVRRAKLYYLRDRVGKAAQKIKEKKAVSA